MRKRSLAALSIGVVLLVGCGDNDPPPPDSQVPSDRQDAALEHPLRFTSIGPEGEFRLTLEPDGAAEAQRGISEPFSFTVTEDELAEVETTVAAADLPNQPAEIDPEEEVTDLPVDEFRYGDAHIEMAGGPPELVELSELLVDLVRDYTPEG